MKKIMILACFLLFGCADIREQFEQERLHKLKGQNKEKVIALLGEPETIVQENQVQKWIYETSYVNFTPNTSQIYLNAPQNEPSFIKAHCLTTFIIKDNFVSNVITTGNCL